MLNKYDVFFKLIVSGFVLFSWGAQTAVSAAAPPQNCYPSTSNPFSSNLGINYNVDGKTAAQVASDMAILKNSGFKTVKIFHLYSLMEKPDFKTINPASLA